MYINRYLKGKFGLWSVLFIFFALTVTTFTSGAEKHSHKTMPNNGGNDLQLIFLLTPEFNKRVKEFDISPWDATLILFREGNKNVKSSEELKLSPYGSLRCIKGDDYIFSLTPYLPQKKAVPMDGIYLNGFTGEYRMIYFSENHSEKYAKIPNFGLCYFSDPILAVNSEQEWLEIVDGTCSHVPKKERHKWAKEQFTEMQEVKKLYRDTEEYSKLMESFRPYRRHDKK